MDDQDVVIQLAFRYTKEDRAKRIAFYKDLLAKLNNWCFAFNKMNFGDHFWFNHKSILFSEVKKDLFSMRSLFSQLSSENTNADNEKGKPVPEVEFCIALTNRVTIKHFSLAQRYNDHMTKVTKPTNGDLTRALFLLMPGLMLVSEELADGKQLPPEYLPDIKIAKNKLVIGITGLLYQKAFFQYFFTHVLQLELPEKFNGNLEGTLNMADLNNPVTVDIDGQECTFTRVQNSGSSGTVATMEIDLNLVDDLMSKNLGWKPSSLQEGTSFSFQPIQIPPHREEPKQKSQKPEDKPVSEVKSEPHKKQNQQEPKPTFWDRCKSTGSSTWRWVRSVWTSFWNFFSRKS